MIHASDTDTNAITLCGLIVELVGAELAKPGDTIDCPKCCRHLCRRPQLFNRMHARGIAAKASDHDWKRKAQETEHDQTMARQARELRSLQARKARGQ